jgi:hypothetical protein
MTNVARSCAGCCSTITSSRATSRRSVSPLLRQNRRDAGDRILRARAGNAFKIVDNHLASQPFVIGKRATIADLSMCGYMYLWRRTRRSARWLHAYAELARPDQGAAGLETPLRAHAARLQRIEGRQDRSGDIASRYSSRCSRFSKRIQPSSVSASTVPSERTRAGRAANQPLLDNIKLILIFFGTIPRLTGLGG